MKKEYRPEQPNESDLERVAAQSRGGQAGGRREDEATRYVSFVHRDDAGYGISFPDFPGCVSVGDTVDDAVRRGGEALAFHVEGLCDEGEPIPAPRHEIERT